MISIDHSFFSCFSCVSWFMILSSQRRWIQRTFDGHLEIVERLVAKDRRGAFRWQLLFQLHPGAAAAVVSGVGNLVCLSRPVNADRHQVQAGRTVAEALPDCFLGP